MEGRVMAAVGGCAVLAGVAYILQGGTKSEDDKNGHLGVPGLFNLGNTCYLNSVLQAMASVSVFVSWIKMCDEENKNREKIEKLTAELSTFMQILSQPCHGQKSYDPTIIFQTLYAHGWTIPLQQQDAHEIFQVLTSTLADEQEHASQKTWNSVLSDQCTSPVQDESIVLRSGVAASKVEKRSWSPFVGLFANQLCCKTCSYKYPVKFDSFDTVSLSLLSNIQCGGITLHGLIRNFMCSEALESSKCAGCDRKDEDQKTRMLKKLSIGKLPQCLCFHINRTYWQNNGVPYKNNTFVTFSESLNIKPYLYTNSRVEGAKLFRLGSSGDGPTKERPTASQSSSTVNTVYSLVAVIDHRGGVENGHYVTFRKTRENWHVVSDEMTRTVPLSHVLKSTAYMLFYERTKSA